MSKAPAPDIATLLRYYQANKLTRAINIFFQADGDIQVSVERGRTMAFYGEVGKDPADTLTKTLLPEYLKGATSAGVDFDKVAKDMGLEEDDDDDMSVI